MSDKLPIIGQFPPGYNRRPSLNAVDPPRKGCHDGRLLGSHYFEVAEEDGQSTISHVLEAQCGLAGALRWGLMVRPMHDALIEDAFDRAELALTGRVARPARWSRWVRAMRWLARRRK